jgi:hypothetical protein
MDGWMPQTMGSHVSSLKLHFWRQSHERSTDVRRRCSIVVDGTDVLYRRVTDTIIKDTKGISTYSTSKLYSTIVRQQGQSQTRLWQSFGPRPVNFWKTVVGVSHWSTVPMSSHPVTAGTVA